MKSINEQLTAQVADGVYRAVANQVGYDIMDVNIADGFGMIDPATGHPDDAPNVADLIEHHNITSKAKNQ